MSKNEEDALRRIREWVSQYMQDHSDSYLDFEVFEPIKEPTHFIGLASTTGPSVVLECSQGLGRWLSHYEDVNDCIDSMELQMMGIKP